MKERPILFSGPMVRAIQAGTKTQARRVIDPQPEVMYDYPSQPELIEFLHPKTSGTYSRESFAKACKYGAAGDQLWVRETFCQYGSRYIYRADYGQFTPISDGIGGPWKPSIHMPRIASRITLEITGVRVERLRDIKPEDAIAEGIVSQPTRYDAKLKEWKCYGWLEKYNQWTSCPVVSYETLWESINGEGSWSANPWVWVIEFKKLEAA